VQPALKSAEEAIADEVVNIGKLSEATYGSPYYKYGPKIQLQAPF